MEYRCNICGRPIEGDDIEDRHTDFDGEDIHASCCEAVGPCSTVEVRREDLARVVDILDWAANDPDRALLEDLRTKLYDRPELVSWQAEGGVVQPTDGLPKPGPAWAEAMAAEAEKAQR